MRPMCRMCSCPHAAGNVGLRSSLPGPPPQQHTFGGISTLPTSKRHAQSTVAQAMPHLTATIALFTASTIFAGVIALLMIAFPSWPRTRQLVESPWVLAPIALVYGVLLVWSWQPDTFSLILPGSLEEGFKGGFNPQFFPSLAGIVTLFSRVATAASLWVHILAINLFAARETFLDGLNFEVSTRHSVLLCMLLAPLGLISHKITKVVASSKRANKHGHAAVSNA